MSTLPLKKRRDEPSTWSGAAATIAGAVLVGENFGQLADPSFWSAVVVVITGLFGVFKREKG